MARTKKKYNFDFTVDVHSKKFKTRDEIIQSSKNKQRIMEHVIAYYVIDNKNPISIKAICKKYNISVNSFKSKLYKMTKEEVKKIVVKNFIITDIPQNLLESEDGAWLVKELVTFSLDGQYDRKLNELKKLVTKWEEKENK